MRPLTVQRRQMARLVRDEPEPLTPGERAELELARPRLRSQCVDGPRPCPFVACRYHLFLDVTRAGGLQLTHPGLEPDELVESCALDVADRGGVTLETVGALLQVTRERIRQLQERGLVKLRRAAARGELERFEETPEQPGDFEP
jgi:hypothetical protein